MGVSDTLNPLPKKFYSFHNASCNCFYSDLLYKLVLFCIWIFCRMQLLAEMFGVDLDGVSGQVVIFLLSLQWGVVTEERCLQSSSIHCYKEFLECCPTAAAGCKVLTFWNYLLEKMTPWVSMNPWGTFITPLNYIFGNFLWGRILFCGRLLFCGKTLFWVVNKSVS